MLRNDEKLVEGRIALALRSKTVGAEGYLRLPIPDAHALLQELVATRLHLSLVVNETGNDPEDSRDLARAFLR